MNSQEIVEKLIEAKEAYYLGEPIMSDSDFDDLENELKDLDPNNPYFKKVGMQFAGKKVKHKVRMRSMQKCNDFSGLQNWANTSLKGYKGDYIVENKIDGLSGALHYKEGKLILALTRGNGVEGQDVTENAALISNIPKTIILNNEDVEIRGEFVLLKNTKLDTKGKPLRNLAAGLINRKGNDKEDCKHLSFIAYEIIGKSFQFTEDKISFLRQNGFETFENVTICSDLAAVQNVYVQYIKETREKLPYEIDGLIVQPNKIAIHEELEDGGEHHPVWAIAYKFPNEIKESVVRRIDWQVSKNGYLVPVSNFDPIYLGGAQVKRATLNNAKNVVANRVRVGNRIRVARANDVIPFFEENLDINTSSPELPDQCPCCGTKVEWVGVHLRCPNTKGCREQVVGKIKSWVGGLDADFVSGATVDTLWDNGLIKSITDLYKLKESDLLNLEGFGDRKAENFVYQINKSREMTFSQFAGRLSIPNVGIRAIKKLGIKSYDDFLKFNDSRYVIGQNIIEWKSEPGNLDLLKELHDCVKIVDEIENNGIRICATGKAPMKRSDLIKILESKGFVWNDGVDKDTKILITDDLNSSSSKTIKAKKLGIRIITYADFFMENKIII